MTKHYFVSLNWNELIVFKCILRKLNARFSEVVLSFVFFFEICMAFLHTSLKLNITPPPPPPLLISLNMQSNNQSISPQPSHLPPSPRDPDHVTSNDSSHAAEQVGLSGRCQLCFALVPLVCCCRYLRL